MSKSTQPSDTDTRNTHKGRPIKVLFVSIFGWVYLEYLDTHTTAAITGYSFVKHSN